MALGSHPPRCVVSFESGCPVPLFRAGAPASLRRRCCLGEAARRPTAVAPLLRVLPLAHELRVAWTTTLARSTPESAVGGAAAARVAAASLQAAVASLQAAVASLLPEDLPSLLPEDLPSLLPEDLPAPRLDDLMT